MSVVVFKSKVTKRAKTTIPEPIRAALGLVEGDEIAYRITRDHVILTKAVASPVDDPFATFSEWDGEADRKAYGSL